MKIIPIKIHRDFNEIKKFKIYKLKKMFLEKILIIAKI